MLQRFDLTLFGELSYVSGGGQIIHEIFQFNGPNRPIWVEHISNQTLRLRFILRSGGRGRNWVKKWMARGKKIGSIWFCGFPCVGKSIKIHRNRVPSIEINPSTNQLTKPLIHWAMPQKFSHSTAATHTHTHTNIAKPSKRTEKCRFVNRRFSVWLYGVVPLIDVAGHRTLVKY